MDATRINAAQERLRQDYAAIEEARNLPIGQPAGVTSFSTPLPPGSTFLLHRDRTAEEIAQGGTLEAIRCTIEKTAGKTAVCFHGLGAHEKTVERLATQVQRTYFPNQTLEFFVHRPSATPQQTTPPVGEFFWRYNPPQAGMQPTDPFTNLDKVPATIREGATTASLGPSPRIPFIPTIPSRRAELFHSALNML